jgi:hypothetical protein
MGINRTLTVVKANPKPATESGLVCYEIKCKLMANTISKHT